jgi:hypothetical protein
VLSIELLCIDGNFFCFAFRLDRQSPNLSLKLKQRAYHFPSNSNLYNQQQQQQQQQQHRRLPKTSLASQNFVCRRVTSVELAR